MATCNSCGSIKQKCTCSDNTVTYKSFTSQSSDCGCDETEDCCVETKTSCIEYDGEALECIGIEDSTETSIAFSAVLQAINDRICGISDEFAACCVEEDDSYDLSILEWECLDEPSDNTLETVLQHLILSIESNLWAFDEEQFVLDTTDPCQTIVSINEETVTNTVVNNIIANYITEITNNLNYKIFPDEECEINSLSDGFSYEIGTGLSIEKKCFYKYRYTFAFSSTNINTDTFEGYIAPNGVTYSPSTPINLDQTAAIEEWFLDELGLVVEVLTYVFPTYTIRIEDFGDDATYIAGLIISTGTEEPTLIEIVDTGEYCCKLHFNFENPNEDCCDDCPDYNIVPDEGICFEPKVVVKGKLETDVSFGACDSTLVSITVDGITYTPSAPIDPDDTVTLQAFLDTIDGYTITFDKYPAPAIGLFQVTIEGFIDFDNILTNNDSTSKYSIVINVDDCLGGFSDLTIALVPDDYEEVSEETCILQRASVCTRDLPSLEITYDADWDNFGGLEVRRLGNMIFISGGSIIRAAGDAALDAVAVMFLPAGLEPRDGFYQTVMADNTAGTLHQAGVLTFAVGSASIITAHFDGASGDRIFIPNILYELDTP